jgi:hypothetical protein
MKKKIINSILISLLILFSTPNSTHAFPFSQIAKVISKFFGKAVKKVGDDVVNSSKKVSQETDEVLKKLREGSNEEAIINVKNSSNDKILNDHHLINAAEKAASNDDIRDSVVGLFQGGKFTARTFLKSDYFNNPNLTKKNTFVCYSDVQIFNFTLLIKEKDRNWILLTDNFTTSKSKNISKIPKQELLVIEEKNEYVFLSTQVKKNNKHPSEYFIIANNGKFFFYENNLDEDVEKLLSEVIVENVNNSKFKCDKIIH